MVPESTIRIAFYGSQGVGKSSLAYRCYQGLWRSDAEPSWAFTDRTNWKIKDSYYWLMLSDFARLEAHVAEPPERRLSNFDGAVFVFSLTDHESFEVTCNRIESLLVNGDLQSHAFVLVGTKSDLADERQVSADEAKKFAASAGTQYFETAGMVHGPMEKAITTLGERIIAAQTDDAEDTSKRSSRCSIM